MHKKNKALTRSKSEDDNKEQRNEEDDEETTRKTMRIEEENNHECSDTIIEFTYKFVSIYLNNKFEKNVFVFQEKVSSTLQS